MAKASFKQICGVTLGWTLVVMALVRCSPNASSIPKALLRAKNTGSLNNTAGTPNGNEPIFNNSSFSGNSAHRFVVSFMTKDKYKEKLKTLKAEDPRLSLSKSGDDDIAYDRFKSKGRTDLRLENSLGLSPDEAWISLKDLDGKLDGNLALEHCELKVAPVTENLWEINLGPGRECKDSERAEILKRIRGLTVTFQSKNPPKLEN